MAVITIDLDEGGSAREIPLYWSWGQVQAAVIEATGVSRQTVLKARNFLGFEKVPTGSEVQEIIQVIRFCSWRNRGGGSDCTYVGYIRHVVEGTLECRLKELEQLETTPKSGESK